MGGGGQRVEEEEEDARRASEYAARHRSDGALLISINRIDRAAR